MVCFLFGECVCVLVRFEMYICFCYFYLFGLCGLMIGSLLFCYFL